MKLSAFKKALNEIDQIHFILPDGTPLPSHFHVTEIGNIQKNFIDCGGTIRDESVINFQLFTASDYDHRLSAMKLRSILGLSEKKLSLDDKLIEVEYQGETINKYGLEFNGEAFQLTTTKTDCLAKDKCGIPQTKQKVSLATIGSVESNCAPGSGCC